MRRLWQHCCRLRQATCIADPLVRCRRNLENAVRHNKPMRGVDLSRTERLRIMKCFEVHQQSKTGVSDVSMPPHIV